MSETPTAGFQPGPGTPDVVAPARIRYAGDQPYSVEFEDIYHAADGAAEVRRVFLAPCGLPDLAAERARRGGADATVRIGELGFGSGLNFVVAARSCLDAGARLLFISCEARPLSAADFAAIAAQRAEAHPLYRELAACYPPRLGGWHLRSLAGGRVRLLLWLGDAADALADLQGRQRQPMDAWFLDGFAPDRNPQLWTDPLLAALAPLSRPGTRVATFTAAGRVRRALEAAGFAMRRIDQRPHKRETLAGRFERPGPVPRPAPELIRIAGAGLAGATAARHLAEAGCRVAVFDASGDPEAPPGSALPATVLHGRLLADGSAAAHLRCRAFHHAAAWIRGRAGFAPLGALQLADPDQAARLEAVAALYGASGDWLQWLQPAAAAELARWPAPHGGLHFPQAGVVGLPHSIRALLDHPLISRHAERLTTLPADGPVVLACGPATRAFAVAEHLEIAAVQGQLDLVELDDPPGLPLVGSCYLVPVPGAAAGSTAAGSTYEHRPWHPDRASEANLAQLEDRHFHWRGRARGTRCVSSDRTAIAGPLFDADGKASERVYVSTGHGSAGNASAPLAAAVLGAWILGDCPPLPRQVEALLSPRRFRERQARRGFRHGLG